MNIRRPSLRRLRIAGAATTAVLSVGVLSACSAGSGGEKDDGKLDVVASFYPMQFLATQIGGGHVDVSTLTGPGVEPHDLDITPQQTAHMSEADVLLYLGGLQPAVDEAVTQAGVEHTVDAAKLTSLEKHGSAVGHSHGDEHGHEESGDEHGHEESGEHTDDEAAGDPHIWLDPVKYAEVAEGVGKALQKADPDHAADYEKNTAALVKKLDTLNTDFEDGLKNTRTDTFITTHSAFGYLAERYGLEQESIAGVDPEAEPSPARMKELQKIASEDDVNTVFFEALASDKTAKTLAQDTGLKTDVLDPLEGITDQSKGKDYIEVMRANLAALQKALGAEGTSSR